MGELIGKAWHEVFPDGELIFLGKGGERPRLLAERYGGRATYAVTETPPADWIFLTLKPQTAARVLPTLRPLVLSHSVILSVMTGISLAYLRKGLKHGRLVRAMPNTPGQIGAGLSVCKAEGLTEHEHGLAQRLLSALGEVIWVEEERYIDMATALSGTGPAYVFLFMEALIDAGVHMGLPRHLAEKMVVATLQGSVRYYKVAQKSIATLRHEVTSPGGTTAEAIYRLEKAGFRPALSRAVWAAYQRALSLSPDTAEEAQ